MNRSSIEAGVTGRFDARTTGGNESDLAKRLRAQAQLNALRDAGIRVQSLKREVVEQPKPR